MNTKVFRILLWTLTVIAISHFHSHAQDINTFQRDFMYSFAINKIILHPQELDIGLSLDSFILRKNQYIVVNSQLNSFTNLLMLSITVPFSTDDLFHEIFLPECE